MTSCRGPLSATIIGIYYLAFFAANNLVGWDRAVSARKNAEDIGPRRFLEFCGVV
jgi:hypothetical protein